MTRTNLEPFAIVPRDLIAQIPPRALQVWCCLAQWSDAGDHHTRPTINRIAGELGVSRRAVERAIAQIEKTGRLVRHSGKAAGKGNEYILILTRLKQGTPNPAHPYGKNGAPNYSKEVNQDLLTNPPTPKGGKVELLAWQNFWKHYPKQTPPRQDRPEAARAQFERLTPEEQQAATEAAAILAQVYEAAPEERKRYTPHAAKWLKEKRWTMPPEAIEQHYAVPGLLRDRRAEAARRAANDRQMQEFRELDQQTRKPKPGA
jgi:hypothetical protein